MRCDTTTIHPALQEPWARRTERWSVLHPTLPAPWPPSFSTWLPPLWKPEPAELWLLFVAGGVGAPHTTRGQLRPLSKIIWASLKGVLLADLPATGNLRDPYSRLEGAGCPLPGPREGAWQTLIACGAAAGEIPWPLTHLSPSSAQPPPLGPSAALESAPYPIPEFGWREAPPAGLARFCRGCVPPGPGWLCRFLERRRVQP